MISNKLNAPGSKDRLASASTLLENSFGVGTPEPLHNAQGVHAAAGGREVYVGQLQNHVALLADTSSENAQKR